MATLPDNFADLLDGESEGRKALLKGMVLRQQLVRLAMKGINATRAASFVGCSKDTARAIYRESEFRKEVVGKVDGAFADIDNAFVQQKKSLHERLGEQAEKAFEQLCVMLEDQDMLPSLKIKIAQDFMNRSPETQAGHVVTKLSGNLGSEQLVHAARIAREIDDKVTPIRRVG